MEGSLGKDFLKGQIQKKNTVTCKKNRCLVRYRKSNQMKLSPSSRFYQFVEYHKAIGILTLNCTLRPHLEVRILHPFLCHFSPGAVDGIFCFYLFIKGPCFCLFPQCHTINTAVFTKTTSPLSISALRAGANRMHFSKIKFQSSTGHILDPGASVMEMVPLDFS